MAYTLSPLKFGYSDLEPYIDAKTVEIHYSKHHQTYLDKVNATLEKYPDIATKDIAELLRNLDQVPEEIRTIVRNAGGGYYNHNLYWKTLTPGGSKSQKLEELITAKWGSMDAFKAEFVQKATALFGSGWVWLIKNDKAELEIVSTPNQDIPAGIHLLAIDVWEHAYYLKYQNKRPEYIEAWWQIIDWQAVGKSL